MPNSDHANISFVTQERGGGLKSLGGGSMVANRLLQSGFNINALRTNDTLRLREWIQYDTAVVQVAKAKLVGVADLMAAGLVYDLPNALGSTRLEWETDTDMNPASVSMSGISRSQDDEVEYNLVGMPIPIVHKDWTLNIRHLEASRRTGTPLDVTKAQKAGRSVAEQIESILWNGYTGLGSNNTIFGYTNAQFRNTGTSSADWSSGTATDGHNILADVLTMMEAAQADHMYGPYVIYLPIPVFTNLQADFKANSALSIYQRLIEIPGISAIRSTANLTSKNILMVQMTADVVQMVDGIQPTMVQWESHGGMLINFKIIAIMLPRIRNDSEQQSGIVHFS